MREFIRSIAGDNCWDFSYKEYNFLFAEQKYQSYYLFYFPSDRDQLLKLKKEAGYIFRAIKESKRYHSDMDKNITCILCLKVDDHACYEASASGKVSDLGKIICLVEEDLNYFKKNVLLYTEKMDEFSKEHIGCLKSLCQEYFTEENYKKYKKSYGDNIEYDFLINLFIKIPFLSFEGYQPGNRKEYQSMEAFIKARLTEKELNLKLIEEICIHLEENLQDDDALFKYLDAMVKEQINEAGMTKEEQIHED